MKKLIFLLSAILPFVSVANLEKEATEKTEQSEKISKSIYERLAEKGRGEIKESADSGRTTGGSKCVKAEK